MRYFQQLPKISYSDFNGNQIKLTNLLVRAEVIPELLKNPLLYYSYDVQEGDTPEIVADKYYGSTDDFWLVMFSNQALDPQWDWPLSYLNFSKYIVDKYGSIANAQSQIDHYALTVVTTDVYSGQTNTETTIVDYNTYLNTQPSNFTGTLPNGQQVSIQTTPIAVSSYDTSLAANEAKRSIKLIDAKYAGQIKAQLVNLLSI